MGIGTPALWAGFIGAVIVLLALDLFVFHRKDHVISVREASRGAASGSRCRWASTASSRCGSALMRGSTFSRVPRREVALGRQPVRLHRGFATFAIGRGAAPRPLLGHLQRAVLRALMIFGGIACSSGSAGSSTRWAPSSSSPLQAVSRSPPRGDRRARPPDSWLRARGPAMPSAGLALIAIELTDVVFAVDSVPARARGDRRPLPRLHLEHLRAARPALALLALATSLRGCAT